MTTVETVSAPWAVHRRSAVLKVRARPLGRTF